MSDRLLHLAHAGRLMRLLPALLLAAWVLPAVATAPVGEWAIVDSPNSSLTRTHNFLTATTCVTATDCWAVGYYSSTVSTFQALVQHWDGSSWSVVPSPNSGVTQSHVLRGVSCVAADDCWAVGSYSEPASPQRTLILHWDGAAWTLAASPNSGPADYNYLFGVHCAGASSCWAVGYRSAGSGFQTLALRWDGSAWTLAPSPNASGAQQTFLEAVSCASAADCWAVGWFVQPGTAFNQTFVLRWNGAAWATAASPNALLSTHNDLHGVACVSASDCWAAGSSETGGARQTLVLRWNGSAWAVVASPSTAPTADNLLRGLACASAADCVAIGSQDTGSGARTLVLRWNGSAWAVVASPNAGTAADNTLFGAACDPGGGCWTVGFHLDAGIQQSLALRRQGSDWTLAATPNRFAPQNNTLLGVACTAPDACWAVASYYNGSVQQTLIERWDGAAWSVFPSPDTADNESNILYDISCVAADDCWVVGYALGATGWRTLILHWDGAAWAIVESPSVAGGNNFLNDVACVSASDCWAVGFHDTGVYQTLILHWDGAAWAIVESPNTDLASENRLSGVACAAADDCWAVGFHKVDGFLQRSLAAHWNGTAWAIVASPNTAAFQNNWLEDVACESATACWAVGAYSPGAVGTGQPLILRWGGGAWTVAVAPQPSANQNNYLRGVTCAAPSDCWAVGDFFSGGSARTLVERWDGSAWSVVASPNTGADQPNRLVGIHCVSPRDCWSVGYSTSDAGIFRTLTLRYSGPPAPEPEPFGFVERTGVATAAWITSEAVTLSGFDVPLPVTVDNGGQYRINSNAWTSAAGQVGAGDTLRVRHVSADAANAGKVSTVAVGTYRTGFRSLTSGVDRTPEAFTFGSVAGVEGGMPATSDPVEIRGFSTPLAIVPGPGIEYRVGDGPWSSRSGTLPYTAPWTTLTVRHVANSSPLGYTRSYLKVGGVAGYFTTRTR